MEELLRVSLMSRLLRWIQLGVLFLSLWLLLHVFFYQLGRFPLENWDEAWYAQVTKEMLETKDFVVMHWNYDVWLDKPPMYMWITALLSVFLGLSEWTIRLPSAISACIIVIGATTWVYKKYSFIPAVFTFFTLILNNLYVYRARSGNLDLLASLFIFCSYFLLLSKSKYKYLLLGIVFGCLYLTKASLVFFPMALFVMNEVLYERVNFTKNIRTYIQMVIIFLIIAGGWLFLGYREIGKDFANYFLFKSDQGVGTFTEFNPDYITFVYYSLQRRFFWLLLMGVAFTLMKIRKQEIFLLLGYTVLLLIQLSFTHRSNNWYLLPSIPFWSITIGYGVHWVLMILERKKVLYYGGMLGMLVISMYIWQKTYRVNIRPIFSPAQTVAQRESALRVKELSTKDEVVVRLDPLIPTTLYYSDRRIWVYSPDSQTGGYIIGKDDLHKGIENKSIRILVGTRGDVDSLLATLPGIEFERVEFMSDEVIALAK